MASNVLPGTASPAAGFDDPFGMLDACHQRVRRSLALLGRLVEHVRLHGADDQARDAARDVLRYFEVAAPAHHADEEIHVVPALRASGDAEAAAAADRLLDDHVHIRAAWAALAPPLARVAAGEAGDVPGLAAAARVFVDLHDGHLALEDGTAFPRAAAIFAARDAAALAAMGDEMACRRGVGVVEPAQARAPRAA